MVRRAGSPAGIVHDDMTLTRSKVKVKGHGAFQLPKISEAVHGGNDRQSPCGVFWYLNIVSS